MAIGLDDDTYGSMTKAQCDRSLSGNFSIAFAVVNSSSLPMPHIVLSLVLLGIWKTTCANRIPKLSSVMLMSFWPNLSKYHSGKLGINHYFRHC